MNACEVGILSSQAWGMDPAVYKDRAVDVWMGNWGKQRRLYTLVRECSSGSAGLIIPLVRLVDRQYFQYRIFGRQSQERTAMRLRSPWILCYAGAQIRIAHQRTH